MTKKIRFFALFLALLLCMPLLASCGDNKKVVATLGDYELYYEYLRFATLNCKADLEALWGDGNAENGTIWDDPTTAAQYKPLLEEAVWEMIGNNYAILEACSRHGIGRDVYDSAEIQDVVKENMEDLKNSYTNYTAYEEALIAAYMTEDVFRLTFALEEMKAKLYNALKEEEAFMTDLNVFRDWLKDDNCAYVQHIARYVTGANSPLAQKAMITHAQQELASGEHDLAYYISYYNEDTTNTAPYFMVRYVVKDELIDAALALEHAGDVSEVIDVGDAYYVLVREVWDDTKLESALSDLLENYQWAMVGEEVERIKGELQFSMTDFGREIDLLEIQ